MLVDSKTYYKTLMEDWIKEIIDFLKKNKNNKISFLYSFKLCLRMLDNNDENFINYFETSLNSFESYLIY